MIHGFCAVVQLLMAISAGRGTNRSVFTSLKSSPFPYRLRTLLHHASPQNRSACFQSRVVCARLRQPRRQDRCSPKLERTTAAAEPLDRQDVAVTSVQIIGRANNRKSPARPFHQTTARLTERLGSGLGGRETMLQCMSLEVARRGPPEISAASPLSGEKRTSNAQNEPFRF